MSAPISRSADDEISAGTLQAIASGLNALGTALLLPLLWRLLIG
jgi:hypothetical protein